MTERWEGYLKALERWGEPKDVDDAFSAIGRPKEFQERQAEIKAMLENRRRIRWFLGSAKEAAIWISAVGGALALIYAGYNTFLDTTPPPPSQPPAAEQMP